MPARSCASLAGPRPCDDRGLPWKLTVRTGPRVERSSFTELGTALERLEARARELADAAPGESLNTKVKRFEPADQVLARLELAGPQRIVPAVRGGVDVHGDGSVEAYRGWVRRQTLETGSGETAYAALRRALT
jgi:hypothetical protein